MTDPRDLTRWARVYHAALKAKDQQATADAFLHIAHINRSGTVTDTMTESAAQDAMDNSPDTMDQLDRAGDPFLAGGLGAAQGASLGFAGRIPGVKNAIAGAREQEPLATAVGDVSGSLLLPAGVLPKGALSMGNPLLRLGAQGVATGAAMGGIRGANEAEAGERGQGALVGSIIGGLIGSGPALVKGSVALPKKIIQGIDNAWAKGGPTGPSVAGQAVTKGKQVAQGFAERLANWGKTGSRMPTERMPANPPTMSSAQRARFNQAFGRQPETAGASDVLSNVAQNTVQAAVDPSSTPSRPRITEDPVAQQLAGANKGKTLPYYPRGGNPEGASVSSRVPGKVDAAVSQQLADQISLARMMGNSDEQIATLLQRQGMPPQQVAAALSGS